MKRSTFWSSRIVRGAIASILCAAAVPGLAHHSFAMYDSARVLSVKGTVKEFHWTNPHVLLWLIEDPAPGQEPQLWTVEFPTTVGNLTRLGWSKRSLQPGDKVTVELSPLRNGNHGGSFKKVTLQNGTVLIARPPPQPDPAAAAGKKP